MSSQQTANHAWLTTLDNLINFGSVAAPRGKKIKEFLGYTSTVDMNYPIVTIPGRKLGYKFMSAEAAWILSGDNRVETIAPYAKHISQFSDDGKIFQGAYGPRILSQLDYVVRALAADQDTRQAVLTIWKENPGPSKDFPCTVAVQWFIRDGKLHCMDTMRSSDIWLGWPYDIFNFSMLSFVIRARLFDEYQINLEIGELRLIAGSQHLYEINLEAAQQLVDSDVEQMKLEGEYPTTTSASEALNGMHWVDIVDFLWASASFDGALTSFGGGKE